MRTGQVVPSLEPDAPLCNPDTCVPVPQDTSTQQRLAALEQELERERATTLALSDALTNREQVSSTMEAQLQEMPRLQMQLQESEMARKLLEKQLQVTHRPQECAATEHTGTSFGDVDVILVFVCSPHTKWKRAAGNEALQ